ncbi:hypothetical protein LQW54_001912 [Pestalotiopsis sp. IQ-011]
MSQRNSASHSSRRPRAGAAAAAMEMEVEMQQDSTPVPAAKAESSSRGRDSEKSPPISSRSKSVKRSKSTVKLNERGKSTHRGKSTNRKEDREEARMLKVVDNLATEIEDRDKRIEELVAELEALKILSTTTEAELRKLLDAASAVAEEAKQLDGDRAEKMKRLEALVESNGKEVKNLQQGLDKKSRQLEVSRAKQRAAEERGTSLTKERDVARTKEKQLETQVSKLQEAAKPISRLVVICLDGSGSLKGVLGQVKQVYRDLILYLKAKCADAQVALITHGCSNMVFQAHTISEWSLILVGNIGSPGSEDYSYCLTKAQNMLEKDASSRRVVVMIGDGDANYSEWTELNKAMTFLKGEGIPAHSIVVPSGYNHVNGTNYSMQQISGRTGGRTESQKSYFSALDDFVGGK